MSIISNSSQRSVDVSTKPRLLQFARTIAIDPTTATTIKDPTQLDRTLSIAVSQTARITQQLEIVKDQL